MPPARAVQRHGDVVATALIASVLFVVYALVTVQNWRRCARGRLPVPVIGGLSGLAAGVLVDTPILGMTLLALDPATLVLVRRVAEWRRV